MVKENIETGDPLHLGGVSIRIGSDFDSLVGALVLFLPAANQGVNVIGRYISDVLHLDVVLDRMLNPKINTGCKVKIRDAVCHYHRDMRFGEPGLSLDDFGCVVP